MAPVRSAVELTTRCGDLTAASNLSFDLEAGSVTGFLGPNGSGKTTTLRMLLGLAEPTHGRALVFGVLIVGGAGRSDRSDIWQRPKSEDPT